MSNNRLVETIEEAQKLQDEKGDSCPKCECTDCKVNYLQNGFVNLTCGNCLWRFNVRMRSIEVVK